MVTVQAFKTRKEWLESRHGLIGGSDAASVLGLNLYKNNVDLYMEKTGQTIPEDISDKPYVKYGVEAEAHLRAMFALDYPQYTVEYVENNMWINDKYPFAHASLDGWMTERKTGKKGVLEIKTTEIKQGIQREKWDNRIPDNYYIQCLHQLMITEFDFVVLKAQLKSRFDDQVYLQTKHYLIWRDECVTDISYLSKKEQMFADNLTNKIAPALILPAI